MERDDQLEYMENLLSISTHTLTWSVTWSIIIGRKNLNFNSHAHVERDAMIAAIETAIIISTHTLTWSVTQ